MSKQHHFVVAWDDQSRKWEITEGLLSGEDEPIYDTVAEEWIAVRTSTDQTADNEALDDLRRRLDG